MGGITRILCLLFFLGFLCPSALAQGVTTPDEQVHDCIVVLLDASGSMNETFQGNETRMDAAKRILTQAIASAPPETYIGFLVMSGARDYEWMQKLGSSDRQALLTNVQMIRPDRSTPLGSYLKMAADELLAMRERQHNQGMYTLLVLTDGQANPDREERRVKKFTPEIRSRGILIHAVGIDMSEEHTLATQADTYQSATNAQALESRVREVFAEVSSATDPRLAADAYEMIAPLPTDVAMAIVQGLGTASKDNYPIGEEKPVKQDEAASQQATPADQAQEAGGCSAGQIMLIFLCCILAVAAIGVLLSL